MLEILDIDPRICENLIYYKGDTTINRSRQFTKECVKKKVSHYIWRNKTISSTSYTKVSCRWIKRLNMEDTKG